MADHGITMATLREQLRLELVELDAEEPSAARDLVHAIFEAFEDFAAGRADRPWADALAGALIEGFGDVMETVFDAEPDRVFGLAAAYARTADMLIGVEQGMVGISAAG